MQMLFAEWVSSLILLITVTTVMLEWSSCFDCDCSSKSAWAISDTDSKWCTADPVTARVAPWSCSYSGSTFNKHRDGTGNCKQIS